MFVKWLARSSPAGTFVSTFGPDGPMRCSGLDVIRYDADSLHDEFGVRFHMLKSRGGSPRDTIRYYSAVFVLSLPR